MTLLVRCAHIEALGLLLLLATIVFFQSLTGRIRIAGILQDKSTGLLDPARVQLLMSTLFLSISVLGQIGAMHRSHEIALPSTELLYVMGGSQGVYLVRKFQQMRSQTLGG